MSEIVEHNCHLQVGAHPAQWKIHEDGSWSASYGPHSDSGQHESVEDAKKAAAAWINTLHRSYGHKDLI